jgi:hypothetical protein
MGPGRPGAGARPFRMALLVLHPLWSGPFYPHQEYREL